MGIKSKRGQKSKCGRMVKTTKAKQNNTNAMIFISSKGSWKLYKGVSRAVAGTFISLIQHQKPPSAQHSLYRENTRTSASQAPSVSALGMA